MGAVSYRIHIAHVPAVRQPPWLNVRNGLGGTDTIRPEGLRKRVGGPGKHACNAILCVYGGGVGTASRVG